VQPGRATRAVKNSGFRTRPPFPFRLPNRRNRPRPRPSCLCETNRTLTAATRDPSRRPS
jgi:hypothetical protein